MDINQPFVTQEQKFKYWEESKAEIKSIRLQREELLKALKEIESANWHFSMSRKIAKEAIEKAEAIK